MRVVQTLKSMVCHQHMSTLMNDTFAQTICVRIVFAEHVAKFQHCLNVINGIGDYYRENMSGCIVKVYDKSPNFCEYFVTDETPNRFFYISPLVMIYFGLNVLGGRKVIWRCPTSTLVEDEND